MHHKATLIEKKKKKKQRAYEIELMLTDKVKSHFSHKATSTSFSKLLMFYFSKIAIWR